MGQPNSPDGEKYTVTIYAASNGGSTIVPVAWRVESCPPNKRGLDPVVLEMNYSDPNAYEWWGMPVPETDGLTIGAAECTIRDGELTWSCIWRPATAADLPYFLTPGWLPQQNP
jgi:hypothetical protein